MGALTSVIRELIRKFCITSPLEVEELDNDTGLTAEEKQTIIQIWDIVSQNLSEESINFFNLLFTEYPDVINRFPSFRGMKLEELNKKPKFIAHANNVFNEISLFVETLDEPDEFAQLLLKTGRDHHNAGVSMEEFYKFAIVFDKFLASKLGKNYTTQAKESWTKALTLMNNVIEDGIEDGKAANLDKE